MKLSNEEGNKGKKEGNDVMEMGRLSATPQVAGRCVPHALPPKVRITSSS
jgi:hypothetical protein